MDLSLSYQSLLNYDWLRKPKLNLDLNLTNPKIFPTISLYKFAFRCMSIEIIVYDTGLFINWFPGWMMAFCWLSTPLISSDRIIEKKSSTLNSTEKNHYEQSLCQQRIKSVRRYESPWVPCSVFKTYLEY